MTDIVERLRTWADIHRHGARPGGDLMAEAANEIERLRAALERVLADIAEYERVNNLAPNPGRQYCWDSVANAHAVLEGKP